MKVHTKLIKAFGALLVVALLFAVLPVGEAMAQTGSTISVSQPIQVTDSEYYERGQSIVYDGSDYWLFYGRSATVKGNYQDSVPDVHDYAIFYKKASSVGGLATATPTAVPGAINCYNGEIGATVLGGKVWTFCSPDPTGSLYGYYTTDGSSWTIVADMATGMSTGAAHHDEVAFDGKLFVMVDNPDSLSGWQTKYTTDPTASSISWSTYSALGLVNGTGHFFVDGSKLYIGILRTNPTKDNKVLEYDSSTDTWSEISSASSTGWDATLFKAGSNFVFAQAPWVNEGGGRQYIYAWTGTTPANVLDGSPNMVSEAMYGTNTWGDMWPIGFTDNDGDSYLFITSERDQPDQEGTGNIWYLEMDWDTTQDHYTYIQNAVDAASAGDIIEVAAGTYAEGITEIDKNLSIIGATAPGKPIITPTENTGTANAIGSTGRGWYQIHNGANVTLENLVFDGTGKNIYTAIHYHGDSSGGTVKTCDFKNIKYSQYLGRGINNYGQTVEVTGCTFSNIERIGVFTFNSTANSLISDCTYTGKGAGDWLDYGFEVGGGAVATITGNSITNCLGVASSDGSESAGILATDYYGTGTAATINDNTLTNNTMGIAIGYDDTDLTVVTTSGNTFTNNEYQISALNGTNIDIADALANNTFDKAVVIDGDFTIYSSIQAAIDAASDGDTIHVAAGTYSEINILIDKSLTLIGDPGDENPGPGANAPVLDGDSSYGDAFKIANGVSNVTIKGFEIQNYTTDDFDGVGNAVSAWVGSTSNITIQDNYLHDLGYNGVLVGNQYNSDPNKWGDHTGWTVKSNIIEDFGYIGFELTNTSNSTIEDNIIHMSTPIIGAVFSSARRSESGLAIKNNLIDGTPSTTSPVIYIYAYDLEMANPNLDDVLITGNTIATTGTPYQVVIWNINTGTVTNVKVEDNKLSTLRNLTSETIDASPNWWGSACGPASGAVIGDVIYSPWYTDEAMTQTSDGTSYVFPAGASTETMNAIIACAAPGSTLTFEGGTYDGGLEVDNNDLTFELNGVTVGPGSPAFTVNGDNIIINGPGVLDGDGTFSAVYVNDGVHDFTLNELEIFDWENGVYYEGTVTNTLVVDNYMHDLTGDGVFFEEQPVAETEVSLFIQGNLFEMATIAGYGVNAPDDLDVSYNSWGVFTGPVAGTDLPTAITSFTPWTHADLEVYQTDGGTSYPDQVVKGDTITYAVKGDLKKVMGADFVLKYPSSNVSVASTTLYDLFDMEVLTDSGTELHFYGSMIQTPGTGPSAVLDGLDFTLFSVTFTGDVLGTDLVLDVDETTDFFSMAPGYGPSTNVYGTDCVDVTTLEVIDLPTIDIIPVPNQDYVAGLPVEFTVLVNNNNGGAYTDLDLDFTLPTGAVLEYWDGDSFEPVADPSAFDIGALGVGDDPAFLFQATFVGAGDHTISVDLMDNFPAPDVELATTEETFTLLDVDVLGTIAMQGRTVRAGVPLTLTDEDGSPIYGPFSTTSTSELAYNVLFDDVIGGTYEITTNQARYLNVTADLDKQIYVRSAYTIPALELKGGNAIWTDNVIDINDASAVGTLYGTGTIADNADVNFDDKVNIQDLALIGGNYDLTSATAYATWLVPASPEFNGTVSGVITESGGAITGYVDGDYQLTITGSFTAATNPTPFTGTISGDISGTVTGHVYTRGSDQLYAVITGTGASETVRLYGSFVQSGLGGHFYGKIVTGPELPPVTSVTITGPTTVAVGDTIDLDVTTDPAGREVIWSVHSNHKQYASIDQDGNLTGLADSSGAPDHGGGAGTIEIIVVVLDDSGFSTQSYWVTVTTP